MFSKTLLNLIDTAIFPAVLIVAAKIISIVFLAKYFQVSYIVDGVKLVFSTYADFISINSYSSLFMYVAIIGGLMWIVIKAHVFHSTHITPTLSAKLVSANLEELIHSNQTIYTQAFIWLSYAWLATLLFAIQAYYQLSYGWVFVASLAVTVVATTLLVVDVERELHEEREELGDAYTHTRLKSLRDVKKELSI